jgi:hypothetical protein
MAFTLENISFPIDPLQKYDSDTKSFYKALIKINNEREKLLGEEIYLYGYYDTKIILTPELLEYYLNEYKKLEANIIDYLKIENMDNTIKYKYQNKKLIDIGTILSNIYIKIVPYIDYMENPSYKLTPENISDIFNIFELIYNSDFLLYYFNQSELNSFNTISNDIIKELNLNNNNIIDIICVGNSLYFSLYLTQLKLFEKKNIDFHYISISKLSSSKDLSVYYTDIKIQNFFNANFNKLLENIYKLDKKYWNNYKLYILDYSSLTGNSISYFTSLLILHI